MCRLKASGLCDGESPNGPDLPEGIRTDAALILRCGTSSNMQCKRPFVDLTEGVRADTALLDGICTELIEEGVVQEYLEMQMRSL